MAAGRQFNAQLGEWAKAAGEKLDALVRQSAYEIAENIVKDTPVDTGFLRGNWQPSIGEPDAPTKPADPTGANVLSEVGISFAGIKAGDKVYFLNNTEYGPIVEFGSSKAPGRFFVTDNVKRWPVVVEKIAQELKIKK